MQFGYHMPVHVQVLVGITFLKVVLRGNPDVGLLIVYMQTNAVV